MAGLAFASAIGTVCEARNHHPDMTIGWRKVTVSFTTHDAGSQLTDKDFDAAEAIDALGYPKVLSMEQLKRFTARRMNCCMFSRWR